MRIIAHIGWVYSAMCLWRNWRKLQINNVSSIRNQGWKLLSKLFCLLSEKWSTLKGKILLAVVCRKANRKSKDNKLTIFFLFCLEIGFDISWKLSPKETICMKCQSLFSGKNKKKYFKISLLKFFPASGKLCRFLITFANSLDPDQAPQNIGPDLDPSCLTLG